GFPNDSVTGQGMLIYITGNTSDDVIDVGSNSSASLVGTPEGSAYKGMLFFSDRATTVRKSHKLGGGGTLSLVGTIYLTNTLAATTASPSNYQSLLLQGTPGNSTHITGEIITEALQLGGNAGITMTLSPTST